MKSSQSGALKLKRESWKRTVSRSSIDTKVHTVKVDLFQHKAPQDSHRLERAAEISTEKKAYMLQECNNWLSSRSACLQPIGDSNHIVRAYSTVQHNAVSDRSSTQIDQVDLKEGKLNKKRKQWACQTSDLVGIKRRTSMKGKQKTLTKNHSQLLAKENLVRPDDLTKFALETQKTTNYNLRAQSILSYILHNPENYESRRGEIPQEEQDLQASPSWGGPDPKRKHKRASFKSSSTVILKKTKSVSVKGGQTSSKAPNSKKRDSTKPSTLQNSQLLLQLAQEKTTTDFADTVTETIRSLRGSVMKEPSDASIMNITSRSKSPRLNMTGPQHRQLGNFPSSNTTRFNSSSLFKKRVTPKPTSSKKSTAQTSLPRKDQFASEFDQTLELSRVVGIQNETRSAQQERDLLQSQNAERKSSLKSAQTNLTNLAMGNTAVATEIQRLESESAQLLKTHLGNKGVLQNLCQENEADCRLIHEFEDSNAKMKEQLKVEDLKKAQARFLIKYLKQQLIKATKERDQGRVSVQISRKQLAKHQSNLSEKQKLKGMAMSGMEHEMDLAIKTSALAVTAISPPPKESRTVRNGDMTNPFRSISSFQCSHTPRKDTSFSSAKLKKGGSKKHKKVIQKQERVKVYHEGDKSAQKVPQALNKDMINQQNIWNVDQDGSKNDVTYQDYPVTEIDKDASRFTDSQLLTFDKSQQPQPRQQRQKDESGQIQFFQMQFQ